MDSTIPWPGRPGVIKGGKEEASWSSGCLSLLDMNSSALSQPSCPNGLVQVYDSGPPWLPLSGVYYTARLSELGSSHTAHSDSSPLTSPPLWAVRTLNFLIRKPSFLPSSHIFDMLFASAPVPQVHLIAQVEGETMPRVVCCNIHFWRKRQSRKLGSTDFSPREGSITFCRVPWRHRIKADVYSNFERFVCKGRKGKLVFSGDLKGRDCVIWSFCFYFFS